MSVCKKKLTDRHAWLPRQEGRLQAPLVTFVTANLRHAQVAIINCSPLWHKQSTGLFAERVAPPPYGIRLLFFSIHSKKRRCGRDAAKFHTNFKALRGPGHSRKCPGDFFASFFFA